MPLTLQNCSPVLAAADFIRSFKIDVMWWWFITRDVTLQRWFLLTKVLFTAHALNRWAINTWADVFYCKHGTGAEKITLNIRFSSLIWVEPSPTSWYPRGVHTQWHSCRWAYKCLTPIWGRTAKTRWRHYNWVRIMLLEQGFSVTLPCRPLFHILF